jgi:tRNA pseudouridine38-40 synthase
MRNIKLIIQYDGTHYHGWQIQTQRDTVQGKVQEAIRTMVRDYPIKLVGASRTDAGVHAIGQVGNFRVPDSVAISCASFYHGLNSLTPDDIIITDVQDVAPEFHARFDARGKTYCYQIFNAENTSIYHQRFSWHIRYPLDVLAMRQASKHLLGCQDFKSFQASSCGSETTTRTVFAFHIQRYKNLVRMFIRANAYLHRMVRNIVGTLVEVGVGRREPDDILNILKGKDRTLAGVTAPSHGLFLFKVHY